MHPQTAVLAWPGWNHVLCTDILKTAILAKTCLCPGFAALVSNLVAPAPAYNPSTLEVGACTVSDLLQSTPHELGAPYGDFFYRGTMLP